MFEFKPGKSRWFAFLWGNTKYRVFRIITLNDERTAMAKAEAAQVKIAKGLLKQAETEAEHALLYDPGNKTAQEAILRIDALGKIRSTRLRRDYGEAGEIRNPAPRGTSSKFIPQGGTNPND
jgi:hypothetical protein